MAYVAEVVGTVVVRVIVAPDVSWCEQHLGGTWVETIDPYATLDGPAVYAGPGQYHDPGVPEQFVSDVWDASRAQTMQSNPYEGGFYWTYNTQGQLTWRNGKAWRNLLPTGTPNVWEPGVANWREYPMGTDYPIWLQPSGAVDAYPAGFVVEHNGAAWVSEVAANVWEPGAVGSDSLWTDLATLPPPGF